MRDSLRVTEMTLGAAADYAAGLHTEPRKGTDIPFVSHLLAVAALVLEDGGGEEEAIAALLHDTAEDHGGEARLADIEEKFGRRVREIVEGCSDSLLEEDAVKEDWRPRKERYLAHLEATDDVGVLRVSAADKLHNVRSIAADYALVGDELWQRFRTGSAADQLWYYGRLAEIHRSKRPDSPVVQELDKVVRELEAAVT